MKFSAQQLFAYLFLGMTLCGYCQSYFVSPAFSHSSLLSGQGGTGTSVLTDDPFAFSLNPAQLGSWSKTNNIGSHFYTSKTNLFLGRDVTFDNQAVTIGLNLKQAVRNLDISVGFGFINSTLDRGTKGFSYIGGTDPIVVSNLTDIYKAYALGVGLHSFIDLSFGFTWKHGTLNHPENPEYLKYTDGDSKIDFFDYGVLMNVPLHEYILPAQRIVEGYDPFINLSIGLVRRNQGDNIYVGAARGYAAGPRQTNLGYSLNFGTDAAFCKRKVKAFSVTWTTEAERFLYENSAGAGDEDIHYAGGLGGISVIRNLIARKGDDQIMCRRGFGVELAGFLTISRGNFSGAGAGYDKTYGFSVKGSGLLQLINCMANSEIIEYLVNHFDLQFHQGTQHYASLPGMDFNGLVLIVHGFSLDRSLRLLSE